MKRVLQILLLVAIIGLVYWNFKMIETPVKFETHFEQREAAVIEAEKYIIPLVQAYRDANPAKKFTTNWDELIDFALNGTIEYRSQIYDENNLENAAILAELRKDKNWKNERVLAVAARDTLFDDALGNCRLDEEHIRNLRYVPFTDKKEFLLDTASYEIGTYKTHLIRCHAPYVWFIDTDTYNQDFWNKMDEKFQTFVNHSEASENMKKMKADGLKTAITREKRYMIGEAHPIELNLEFFGVTFGSLEEPTNEAGNWSGGGAE